jgi:hypothetical protein
MALLRASESDHPIPNLSTATSLTATNWGSVMIKSKLQRNDYVACVKPFCASPGWRLLRPEVPARVVTLHYPEICNSHKATTTFLLGDKTFRVG